MNAFTFVVFMALAIASVVAASASGSSASSSSSSGQEIETEAQPAQTAQLNSDYNRFRKAASYGGGSGGGYGGASIPAPPCPKNYLFSCQPNLSPVPCAAPAPSHGSAGAYSAPVPTYVSPLGNTYGVPQSYSGFVPPSYNQFYTY